MRTHAIAAVALALSLGGSSTFAAAPQLNGPLPSPFPLFPADNWWNADVSGAPVDSASAAFMTYMNTLWPGQTSPLPKLRPDFGGINTDDPPDGIYGFPYAVVDGTQAKKTVQFLYSDESDGVDHATNTSFPFYPVPDEAITQPHWIESGQPGNQDLRSVSDRHMLIVDQSNRLLYELYNVFFDGATWRAGSGALFDLASNARRPEGWTSADAAGLAILPGLVRYEEVFGTPEIGHAFRVTVQCSSGHVYPASHTASTAGNARCQKQPFAPLPMGARLRLKAATNISGFTPEVQKIFRAMKKYGLIVADNGSDLFVSGTFDTRWDNGVLNPAFGLLSPLDFEVVEMGWKPGPTRPQYRLYSPTTLEHLYTTDYNEYATLGTRAWNQEGIAYQLFRDTTAYLGVTPTPLYRLYHPGILQHLWTTDANEKNVLVAGGSWTYEGVAGYVLPTAVTGSTPLLRMSLPNPPLHLWTTDQNEYTVLQTRGWIPEGAIGHVLP